MRLAMRIAKDFLAAITNTTQMQMGGLVIAVKNKLLPLRPLLRRLSRLLPLRLLLRRLSRLLPLRLLLRRLSRLLARAGKGSVLIWTVH